MLVRYRFSRWPEGIEFPEWSWRPWLYNYNAIWFIVIRPLNNDFESVRYFRKRTSTKWTWEVMRLRKTAADHSRSFDVLAGAEMHKEETIITSSRKTVFGADSGADAEPDEREIWTSKWPAVQHACRWRFISKANHVYWKQSLSLL